MVGREVLDLGPPSSVRCAPLSSASIWPLPPQHGRSAKPVQALQQAVPSRPKREMKEEMKQRLQESRLGHDGADRRGLPECRLIRGSEGSGGTMVSLGSANANSRCQRLPNPPLPPKAGKTCAELDGVCLVLVGSGVHSPGSPQEELGS